MNIKKTANLLLNFAIKKLAETNATFMNAKNTGMANNNRTDVNMFAKVK